MISTKQKQVTVQDIDLTTKQTIELEIPEKRRKIVLTVTKRHYYDPMKNKIVTDQVVHRAKYSLKKKKGGKK